MATPRRKPLPALANLIASIAPPVLHDVFDKDKRLEPAIAAALGPKSGLSHMDRRMVHRALSSLVRWWGWIEPLRLVQIEEQLLLAWLLDSPDIPGICRLWANKANRDSERLFSCGDAPGWTERAHGMKRFMEGRTITADPWMLFPSWLRDELPLPPGDEPAKSRRLAFLFILQIRSPLWAGVRGRPAKDVWSELRETGLIKPWVHRKLLSAAKIDRDAELSSLEPFRSGFAFIEDLSSQAVAKVCDPDPGDRWWDVFGGSGLHALGLGAEMAGKGTVVSTFEHEPARKAAALRLRGSTFRNISAKIWDGRHAPGKAGTYDGVLVDAPSSGVGAWRRHPEVRWIVRKEQFPELIERQKRLLSLAAAAVKPGGTLVYTVATVTLSETQSLIMSFLAENPQFRLDPFPNPLEEGTTTGTMQIWPQSHDCEARFIARMVRKPNPS